MTYFDLWCIAWQTSTSSLLRKQKIRSTRALLSKRPSPLTLDSYITKRIGKIFVSIEQYFNDTCRVIFLRESVTFSNNRGSEVVCLVKCTNMFDVQVDCSMQSKCSPIQEMGNFRWYPFAVVQNRNVLDL